MKGHLTGRVLIVDDNKSFADITAKLIRLSGYDVIVRYTGPEGYAAARDFLPDVMLLDLGIPNVDGYEVCRKIRRLLWGKKIHIIALTGYSASSTERYTVRAGFDQHLTKTVPFTKLDQAIRQGLSH
ncbi:response regulator [Dyadobacter sp. CY327]|uniref:response regulator n=1 Tax=Dyadobacter sp. CY327 TaxID=2907301 RepID=UPI001F24063D|nr:response regulator [Dyadobacter sp. CY327]MCE7071875.1 response regulator [Dyadobacter sp. CY327]